MRRRHLLLVLGPLLAACGQPGPAVPLPDFDEARAFADLRHLVEEIGDRRIGTPGAEATRAYIRSQLEPLGWVFEEDPFPVVPPEGARRKGEIQGVNLLARRPGTEPGEIWIGSHYDTFDLPGFVGANDGGSSTAVLLELGRQLAGRDPIEGPGITLVWFDGEEKFPPVAWDDKSNSTFGSRHLVERLRAEKRLDEVLALVLLDMVGDRDLALQVESRSSGRLVRAFEAAAQDLGWVGRNAILAGTYELQDDHLHFIRASVPAIDLIDFRYGPSNRWWHTREDTLDKCSAASLGRTGRLVLATLPHLRATLRR